MNVVIDAWLVWTAAIMMNGAVTFDNFWWAVAGVAVIGPLNLAVSFYLAFRLALTAQNVAGVDRRRIYQAMGRRLLRDPRSFVLPVRIRPIANEAGAEPAHKSGGTG